MNDQTERLAQIREDPRAADEPDLVFLLDVIRSREGDVKELVCAIECAFSQVETEMSDVYYNEIQEALARVREWLCAQENNK